MVALGLSLGKLAISITALCANVYFRCPFLMSRLWLTFVMLMPPVDVRIPRTYEVVADLGLLDGRTGLIIPPIASTTGDSRLVETEK